MEMLKIQLEISLGLRRTVRLGLEWLQQLCLGAMRTVFAQQSYKGGDGNVILRNVWNCSIG